MAVVVYPRPLLKELRRLGIGVKEDWDCYDREGHHDALGDISEKHGTMEQQSSGFIPERKAPVTTAVAWVPIKDIFVAGY